MVFKMKAPTILFLFICLSCQIGEAFGQQPECPPMGVVYLPLPDCTKYIICYNGEGTEMECPNPLFYNADTERCEVPANVPDCVEGTRPPIETTTNLPPPENIIMECGQTLVADRGLIEYKLNQTYDNGELCAFIIRLDRFMGCTFTLESNGLIDSGQDAIAIMPLRLGSPLNVRYLGPNNGNQVYFEESGFVVVFKTTTNLGTGFSLRFESGTEEVGKIQGLLSVFNNEEASPLALPYPDKSMLWNPIVLTSGARMLGQISSFRLTVWENFPRDDCGDWFDIHEYNGENTLYLGRTCGKDVEEKVFHTQGLFIIVFAMRSDSPQWGSSPFGTLTWEKVNKTGKQLNI